MGKKVAGAKNVYELAQERLKVIFSEFDNIYVSFSGGKDSGVLLNMCIDYIRKNNLKIRLGVFHMDYEIQYKMTIDYVDRILEANKDILDVYRVCIPFRVSTCTSMYQSFWRPWEKGKKKDKDQKDIPLPAYNLQVLVRHPLVDQPLHKPLPQYTGQPEHKDGTARHCQPGHQE